MRSASYQLTQTGRAADPIWEVWAYGSANRYLGVVKLSARSGNVISSQGSGVFENRRNFCRPIRWFSRSINQLVNYYFSSSAHLLPPEPFPVLLAGAKSPAGICTRKTWTPFSSIHNSLVETPFGPTALGKFKLIRTLPTHQHSNEDGVSAGQAVSSKLSFLQLSRVSYGCR